MRYILPLVLGSLLLFTSCKNPDTNTTSTPSLPVTMENPFSSLIGKWRRTDGNYSIEIKSISLDGKVDAAYYNPGPIHVGWALAKKLENNLTLEIELRDQNYPGCLYKLSPLSTVNQLSGTYFQAMTKEEFSVLFLREK